MTDVSDRRRLRAEMADGDSTVAGAANGRPVTPPDWVRHWDKEAWAARVDDGDSFARSVYRHGGSDSWEDHCRFVAIVMGWRLWQIARREWAADQGVAPRDFPRLLRRTAEVSDDEEKVRT